MKAFTFFSRLSMVVLVVGLSLTTSCTFEQVTPASVEMEDQIQSRTDFSGLEDIVKLKIADRDKISVESITSCTFICSTAQGYGRYDFTSTSISGTYFITGIIGDDYEGF
jgi:hypothetical protein